MEETMVKSFVVLWFAVPSIFMIYMLVAAFSNYYEGFPIQGLWVPSMALCFLLALGWLVLSVVVKEIMPEGNKL